MNVSWNGPFSRSLRQRFGTAGVLMVCGVMIATALIAGSFATTAFQEALIFMCFAGTGYGVSRVLTKETVGRLIDKNYATAVRIARTGYSTGFFVFAPVFQLFLNTYGWRGTMLLMGGITMHLVVSGALVHKTGTTRSYTEYETLPSSKHSSEQPKNNWFSSGTFLDIGLLCKFSYWSVAAIYCILNFGYDVWVIYFVSMAQSKGLSLEEGTTVVMVAGVGNLLAKVAQGIIIDRGVVPYWVLLAIAIGISSASFCASPWLASFWILMTSASLILVADGVASCLTDVLIKQVFGVDLLAGAYGWIGIKNTFIRFTLGFLPGLIYDRTGSYNAAFVLVGCLQSLALGNLFILRYFQYVK